MTARRLIVWRHGRTAWNAENRFQGQADIPLDELGLAQAEAAAAVLEAYRPAALISSDLSRAAQTAKALAARTGLEISYDQDLREIDVGSWAGLLASEIRERFPELSARVRAFDPDVRRGGDGETLREVADRAEKGFRRAIDAVSDGETVVVASHGLATRIGIGQFVGLGPPHWEALGALHNCAWVVVVPGRNGWQIEGWNLRAPLP